MECIEEQLRTLTDYKSFDGCHMKSWSYKGYFIHYIRYLRGQEDWFVSSGKYGNPRVYLGSNLEDCKEYINDC